MATVMERIKKGKGYTFIELAKEEKRLCPDGGLKLTRFEDGKAVEFFNFVEKPTEEEAVVAVREWLSAADGEVWVGCCCGKTLFDPFELTDKNDFPDTGFKETVLKAAVTAERFLHSRISMSKLEILVINAISAGLIVFVGSTLCKMYLSQDGYAGFVYGWLAALFWFAMTFFLQRKVRIKG